MARNRKGTPPRYRNHRPTGQAVVTLDGKDHYLGRYGSADSHLKYERLIRAWRQRQEQSPTQPAESDPAPLVPEEATVNAVALLYIRHAKGYYRPTADGEAKEVGCLRDALKVVRRLYGRKPAGDFGPKALKEARQEMVKKGWARGYINHQVARVKRMFGWATEQQLIPLSVYHGLLALRGLRKGLPGVRESKKVRAVHLRLIRAVLKHVQPMIRAMILFAYHTGCRPGEVCRLKPRRIRQTGEVWVYRPGRHKTAHLGVKRRIYIGPRAQRLLAPWLEGVGPDEYVFSPVRAEALRQAERRKKRATPLYPSHLKRLAQKRRKEPKRAKRPRYDTASFRRAIKRACDVAFPPPDRLGRRRLENGRTESRAAWWSRLTEQERAEVRDWQSRHRWHPNQLRHTAATRIRKQHGIELARIILGHSTAFTTEIYAEVDRKKAINVAAAMG